MAGLCRALVMDGKIGGVDHETPVVVDANVIALTAQRSVQRLQHGTIVHAADDRRRRVGEFDRACLRRVIRVVGHNESIDLLRSFPRPRPGRHATGTRRSRRTSPPRRSPARSRRSCQVSQRATSSRSEAVLLPPMLRPRPTPTTPMRMGLRAIEFLPVTGFRAWQELY